MPVADDDDMVAWADGQAALIRAGRFDQLDLDHLADEIESVGKSEQRELLNRWPCCWPTCWNGRSSLLAAAEARL